MVILQLFLLMPLIIGLFYLKWRFHKKLLKRYPSKISKYVDVVEKYNGERILLTNYFHQGVSIEDPSIRKSYWYAIADKILKHCGTKKHPSILFIGLGANTSSLLVRNKNPKIHQVIVEIDPVVIQACKDYFQLDALQNAEIIEADIFDMVKKKKSAWKNTFDVIVIDTFDANPPYMLHGSHDPAFLNQLYPWLKSDGMFLFNAPVKTTGIQIDELIKYLNTIFSTVQHRVIRDPRSYRNHVISASKKPS